MLHRLSLIACGFALILCHGSFECSAGDWSRFRGPNGAGVLEESQPLPTEWSESKNLKWKAELPGPGSSSPIIVGDKVFLTCWTGYADGDEEGSLDDLKRHLVCLDRKTGKELWKSTVAAVLPEDSYRGMFAENGYATHTPVSDGERVFAFFGKSGVYAYDMEGKELWNAQVGEDRDPRGWGSSSSPILYENLLIVTAAIEDNAIVALNTETGKEVWKQQAGGLAATWGTPIIVDSNDRTDLVIGVPYEVWGLNPQTGKLRWYCEGIGSDSMCSSVVEEDGVIYAMESGPSGGGTVAIKAGGQGDVTESHVIWTGNDRSRIGTPVIHGDHIYWVSSGVVNRMDITTGKRDEQVRLSDSEAAPSEDATDQRERDRFGGGRRGGRGGGGRGGQDYSSPIIADGKLYYARRSGDVHVVSLSPELKQVAVNRFESSAGDFHATPAVSDGDLFIRSSQTLYCVSTTE